MSIFGSIVSAIFGGPAAAATAPPAGTPAAGTPATGAPVAPGASPGPAETPAQAQSMSNVDVAKVLDGIADKSDEDLDWRKSIVDLMKLLKLDSSLKARKALATELHYTGDQNDSASMNIWLHKQVMTKLAQNGGVVPKDL